jgi:hypothetical protein
LFRHSNGTYEIFVDLEALDCCGDVAEMGMYHHAHDILQAWRILQPLRPGSIHCVEGEIRFGTEKLELMAPDILPCRGDIGFVESCFSRYDERDCTRVLKPTTSKTVSGHIKDIVIEKTKHGDGAIILLAERDDFVPVILPDLYESYKSMILRGDYLEYCGIPQESYETENGCVTMIIVETINTPILTDEMEGTDHEQ